MEDETCIFRVALSAAAMSNFNLHWVAHIKQQINYIKNLRNNFPGLYDYYYERNQPTWNHNMMAQHYRNVIADIAQEFDDFKLPREVYEDISWVGLRVIENFENSVAWDKLSSSDKIRIQKNIDNYFRNGVSDCK